MRSRQIEIKDDLNKEETTLKIHYNHKKLNKWKVTKRWKHCNKLMKGLQWTNEDKFEDNVNDVWIDESIVVS
jgi:hypothetical protein